MSDKFELCKDMTGLYNCRSCDLNERWDNPCDKKQELYQIVKCKHCKYCDQLDAGMYICKNENAFFAFEGNYVFVNVDNGCILGESSSQLI